jgi:hypothetical protein
MLPANGLVVDCYFAIVASLLKFFLFTIKVRRICHSNGRVTCLDRYGK